MKQRHLKTFPEKFGLRSDREEFDKFSYEFRKNNCTREQLDSVPCMGYFYLDYGEFNDWWDDLEEPTLGRLLRYGVLEVTEETVTYYHYDDHNWHGITEFRKNHKGFYLNGNVLTIGNDE